MENRKALGRGLEQLFNSETLDFNELEQKIVAETPKNQIRNVSLTDLRSNPYQPRKHFDPVALTELASSIRTYGVFQPIIVKPSIKGYEIVAGERRVRASMEAGLKEVPAIIKEFDDEQMMEIALLENLQRENLSAIEEAQAYQTLIKNLNVTQEVLANKLGKSRSHVTNILGLLKLPQITQQLVIKGDITMAHARVLSKLENKEQILDLSDRIIKEGLTVRALENITSLKAKRVEIKHRPENENEYRDVARLITEQLDTKVVIKDKKIIIHFTSTNDLKRILDELNIKE